MGEIKIPKHYGTLYPLLSKLKLNPERSYSAELFICYRNVTAGRPSVVRRISSIEYVPHIYVGDQIRTGKIKSPVNSKA